MKPTDKKKSDASDAEKSIPSKINTDDAPDYDDDSGERWAKEDMQDFMDYWKR